MATATKKHGGKVGHVTQVIGSTFDAEFPEDSIPAIYNTQSALAAEVVKGRNVFDFALESTQRSK